MKMTGRVLSFRYRLNARSQARKSLSANRIEMCAGIDSNLSESGVQGQGTPIRTVGGHGIKSVGDAHDASQYGYVLPRQTVRIAGAVPAFVMTAHDGNKVGHVGDFLQKLGPADRV